ncbi:carboxypeptidase regulatory-like domain-containing protein [Porphyrobacter sp. TH134]|uniref:carboxypeptidase regulatory-like domain-containing protein n=1 Tax=Porphyrobacter sp. TH134 TaxID=2067450 RepID=UPI001F2F1185|nr:carboxypeptidase regulatory-like domain-containing protein [Porphyrobacter sp. TH134]
MRLSFQTFFSIALLVAGVAGAAVVGLGSAARVAAAAPASLRVQVVDADGLPVRDAVVELRSARAPASPIRFPWKMGMAQKNQQFTPGTLIVAKGSTVAFPNLDMVRHSIYSFSKPARFEIDLYGRDQTRTHTFAVAGSVKLGCNIHDQMRGYIRVTDTPFAGKTDHNGYVALSGMPAGSASLTVWHPGLRSPSNESKSGITISGGAQTHKLTVALR